MNGASFPFWVVFNLIIAVVLWVDLKFVHKEAHAVSIKEAAGWSLFWIALALAFDAGIYWRMGSEKAMQFLTGYVIEKSLSVDNLFVFLMIFDYFKVPDKFQPQVLHWGILGAIVMRFILIFSGAALLQAFHWIIYLFGAFLIFTGVRMAFEGEKEEELEPEKNLVVRGFSKLVPTVHRKIEDRSFFVRVEGALHATPLFVTLLVIESMDLVFAVDSIPAIFAVTTDTFIVYTSNIFAILGLRALYFLLSGIMPYFRFLKFGISIVLAFVGTKMLVSRFYEIPTPLSLGVVAGVLAASVAASLVFKKGSKLPDPHSRAS